MGQLEDMAMFVRIVDAGGISKAAEQLNIAKSAVSRRLNELESRLGSQLLTRTTRKSKLTDTGEQYYLQAINILDEVDSLNEQASGKKVTVDGTLKMTMPLSFGLMHLSELLNEYATSHQDLKLQLEFSDRKIDLVEEGYELAIRIGELQDSSFQAKRITTIRHMLCASPGYLAEMGTPQTVSDMDKHVYLQYALSKQSRIELVDKRGRQHSIEMKPKFKANNGDFLLNMAIQGHGITYLPTFLTYKAVKEGLLVPVLPDYELPVYNAYAVYPRNRFLSHRCRLLIDFIADRFGDMPYWDQPKTI